MVFWKVGFSVFEQISSISFLADKMEASNAGLKCVFLISENGAVLNLVLNLFNNGLFIVDFGGDYNLLDPIKVNLKLGLEGKIKL
jgi:hypothetical protein